MNSVPLKQVLRQVASRCGFRYEDQEADLVSSWVLYAGDRVREAWGAWRWPDVMVTEERPVVTGSDDERFVEFVSAGKTTLEAIFEISERDPRQHREIGSLYFRALDSGRVYVDTPLTDVWVQGRRARPGLRPVVDDGNTAYAASEEVFFDHPGDVFVALTARAAGSNPIDDPAEWAVVPIPAIFERYLVTAIHANWLDDQGEMEKAPGVERKAQRKLEEEMEIILKAGQLPRVYHRVR